MPPPTNVKVGVTAWIAHPDDPETLLFIKRGDQAMDGYLTHGGPGGWIEPGESVGQAVEREVLEEIGMKVIAGRAIGMSTNWSDDNNRWIVCIFIECTAEVEYSFHIREPHKIAWVGWATRDEVREGLWPLFAPWQSFLNAQGWTR